MNHSARKVLYIKRPCCIRYFPAIDLLDIKNKILTVSRRNVTSRTKSINTSSIGCLAVTACHTVDVHILSICQITGLEIYGRAVFTAPEMNCLIRYPPLAFPCLRHLGKGINQVYAIIRNELGSVFNRSVNLIFKILFSIFVSE